MGCFSSVSGIELLLSYIECGFLNNNNKIYMIPETQTLTNLSLWGYKILLRLYFKLKIEKLPYLAQNRELKRLKLFLIWHFSKNTLHVPDTNLVYSMTYVSLAFSTKPRIRPSSGVLGVPPKQIKLCERKIFSLQYTSI